MLDLIPTFRPPPIQPLVTDGVSTELFLAILSAMGGAIIGLAKVMDAFYRNRIKQLEETVDRKDETIAAMQSRLDAYGTLSPEVIEQVQSLLKQAITQPSQPSSGSSQKSAELPFPHHRAPRIRRRTGGS